MKRLAMCLLTIITLALCVFSLSSCKKKIRVETVSYYKGGVTVMHDGSNTVIRFYKDPAFEYDVADFEKVKISFDHANEKGTRIKNYKGYAYPPENARGNTELQYFELVLENEHLPLEDPIHTNTAKGTLNNKKSEELKEKNNTPSIFMTFIIGIVGTILAVGSAIFGLHLWDDPQGRYVVAASIFIPICMNIATYFIWDTARGIILSFFCAAIIALTIVASRFIDY